MTTKDTREKIARALCNRHLGEGAFDDLLLDTETRIAYLEDADAILEALTATPAQPTPERGEVDGLVAEIDALFEKASGQPWGLEKRTYSWNITGVSKGNHPGKVCLARTEQWGRTDDWEIDVPEMDANAALIVALVNAWPRIRTALGGGWRDDMENAPRGTPVLLKSGLTDRLFIGFNMGDGWIERGSRHVDRPPTHWMPLPPPPQLEGET